MKTCARGKVSMTRTIVRKDGSVERDPRESFGAAVAYWWRKLTRRFR